MRRPTDDEIMRALCCGGKCAVGPNTGLCHQWDFTNEAARIRALLERVASEMCLEGRQALSLPSDG